jgi:Immunoglobulin I-set domain
MKKLLASSGLAVLLAIGARGQNTNLVIPPGKLAVFKGGDSTGIYNISTARVQPCFVQIYDPVTNNQAVPVYSFALPTNQPNGIWINDHAGSEGGGISRSMTRQFLALQGYTGNILSPTAAKPSSDPTVYRGFGILDAFGNEQVVYEDLANWFGMPPGVTQNNPTGLATTDGTNFWGTGNVTGTSQEAAGTLFYNVNESSTPFELQNYIQAAAEARIIGGTLYVVVPGQGVYNFLDTENNDAVVPLPFDPNVPNPVEHVVLTNLFLNWGPTFANIANFDMDPLGTVAYGADQTYGIVKFTNNNGAWQQAPYYFNTTNIGTSKQAKATQGCFGICVDFSGTNPVIYATTMETGTTPVNNKQGNPNQNRIIRIVDNGNPGTNVVAQTIATASTTNETFRGIDFGPDLRPLITTQPANYATTNGGSAFFSVGVSSVYSLSYQWLQNSVSLPGKTDASLELDNLNTATNGYDYVCVVTNQYGSVTSSVAVLTVTASAVAPTISSGTAHVNSFVGGNVTFAPVTPTGTEPFTFQWYFGSQQLVDDGVKYSGSASDSLTISNLATADAGNYYLVAMNGGGYASNLVDILTVNYHLPTITAGEPLSVTTFAGYTTSLTASEGGGSLPITNQWYKGSNALTDSGEFSGTATGTLTISPAGTNDAGSYHIVVSNPAGSVTSSVATVTVLIPPPLSSVAYSNQIYMQNFDSLPDPGSNSVNSINNPKDAGSINGLAYSLANPFDFAYPVINSSYVGGLGLSNTMPGWYGAADTLYPGVDGITRFAAQDGDQTTGGVIDFGPNDGPGITGTNRALGLLSTSTTGSTSFAVKLVNTSSTTLNYLTIGFTGELWHNGTGHRTMSFGYTVDPTATNFVLTSESITNSTYVPPLAFSFNTNIVVVATDGTQSANQTNLMARNVALSSPWTPGGALWLIWSIDFYGSGSGNGYAIDNLSLFATPNAYAQATSPLLGSVTYTTGAGAGFSFTNVPSGHFSVYGATNLIAPSWIYLGSPTESARGAYSVYSFSDTHPSSNRQRFYKVTSP